MQRKRSAARLALVLLALLCAAVRARGYRFGEPEEGPGELDPREQKDAGIERPDSFLAVLRKMIHKYPVMKSRMYMMLKKDFSATSEAFGGNPSLLLAPHGGRLEPRDIYLKFKSIIEADQLLKEDMQRLLRETRSTIELERIKKKNRLAVIKDLERDLVALKERKRRATDEIASTEIDNLFAVKYRQILKHFRAYKSAENWEKELNHLLGELLTADTTVPR